MNHKVFHQLLKRYLKGDATEEEKAVVEQWYGILDKEDLPGISNDTLDAMDDKLWKDVKERINQPKTPVIPISRPDYNPFRRLQWVAASVVALILVTGALLFYIDRTSQYGSVAQSDQVQTVNTTGKPLRVALADGSNVLLESGASLMYSRTFDKDRRDVYLKGQAFFNVTKDTKRPFYVHSQQLLVHVVGTSFWVREQEKNTESEVVVVTGKVRVAKAEKGLFPKFLSQKEEVVLTPNQRVTYTNEDKDLTVSIVEDPIVINKEAAAANLIFNENTLLQVFDQLEKTYAIPIHTINKGVYRCTFTGDLSDLDLYESLDMICQSVGASYEVKELNIVLYGGNCR
ncbi:FecR domain-containing protein [Cytophagaceae bacterium DM2B3-1]|uniref:FecR domain-containing protein n=1 Tax=Xanthocytophaga flava TaxID=3048013 RepID=A0ABT7CUM4_9BACT|nr:FecR domain-containing protein [Xanthocytophaga flavus]MDJ1496329.1 FecR domain-containing protein [Xanthocytophaga flavus]